LFKLKGSEELGGLLPCGVSLGVAGADERDVRIV
jgi:hypothetical protein